jgi:hypothetical protein
MDLVEAIALMRVDISPGDVKKLMLPGRTKNTPASNLVQSFLDIYPAGNVAEL